MQCKIIMPKPTRSEPQMPKIHVKILGGTRINRVLPDSAGVLRDVLTNDQNAIVEFAARVCYNSVARMGTNQDFVDDKIRRGHLDVLEHARTIAFVEGYDWTDLIELYGSVKGILADPYSGDEGIISVNRRTLLEAPGKNQIADALAFACKLQTPSSPDIFIATHPHVALLAAVHNTVSLGVDEQRRHGSATFFIDGISRTASHQIARHRAFSISQQSQRYVDQSAEDVIVPPDIKSNPDLRLRFNDHVTDSHMLYSFLRDSGIKKEDARFVLPEATATRMVVTSTFDGWLHFLKLRLPKAAQWEIRTLAEEIQDILSELAPEVFQII